MFSTPRRQTILETILETVLEISSQNNDYRFWYVLPEPESLLLASNSGFFQMMQMDSQTEQTQAYALDYWQAGLVPIPVKLDGSKSPALASWQRYQTERPDRDLVASWFSRPAGIAVLMGSISGGVECIDFDDPSCFWLMIHEIGLGDLAAFRSLGMYQTPRGWHLFYKCSEIFTPTKLARRPDKATRIETRGENSYVIAEGSPPSVHPTGLPYKHFHGPRLVALPTITPAQRKLLWREASKFDQTGEPTPAAKLGRMQAELEYRTAHPAPKRSIEQASKYLAKMDAAIQGADGSRKCFRAAAKLVGYFELDRQDALHLMITEYNPRCSPPWSIRELEHKVDDALRRTGRVASEENN